MKFNITYEISPSGAFGVPQAGKTVYPAEKSKGFLGDTLHVRTLTRVTHGTLSQYRQEEEAIDLPLDLGIVKGKLKDNFIYLEVEGGSIPEAHEIATEALETFLQHLAASTRTVYAAKTLYVESEDGAMCLVPKSAESISATFYILNLLRAGIQEAQHFFFLKDVRLQRALKYYEHAILLYDKRSQIADSSSRHYRYLIAAVFLNLWKSVTAIVGDPTKGRDGYQRRYKEIGLETGHKTRIDQLKKLRNDYDIAHYTLSDDSLTEIEKNFREAQNITLDVIQQYRRFLFEKNHTGI